jgi:hypothetical protein
MNKKQIKCSCIKISNECHLHRPVVKLLCFRKACTVLASEFSSLSCRPISLMNDKAQFKAALKFYVSMHSLYSVNKIIIFKNG